MNSTSSSNNVAVASRCRAKWPWVYDDGVLRVNGWWRFGRYRRPYSNSKHKSVMRNMSHSTTDMISKISWDTMKFCFRGPILNNKYVYHSSKYNGSYKCHVNTNRSDTPISKNVSTTMSILNNVIGSLEWIFWYLSESFKNALSRGTRRNTYVPV